MCEVAGNVPGCDKGILCMFSALSSVRVGTFCTRRATYHVYWCSQCNRPVLVRPTPVRLMTAAEHARYNKQSEEYFAERNKRGDDDDE